MSHEIEIVSGNKKDGNIVAAAVYVNKPAWHKLGRVLTTEQAKGMKAKEFIEHAHCDWPVGTEKIFDQFGKEIPDALGVRRLDNGSYLGTVGPRHLPLQNIEAFEWFDSFIESNFATFESAGSLRDGKHVWALAKVNSKGAEIVKGDFVDRYILLSNAHDGTLSARAGLTMIRVECQNKLDMAHRTDGRTLLKINHTKNIKDRLEIGKEIMESTNADFEKTEEAFKFLASVKMNDKERMAFFKSIFKQKKTKLQQAMDAKKAVEKAAANVEIASFDQDAALDSVLNSVDVPAQKNGKNNVDGESPDQMISRLYEELEASHECAPGQQIPNVRGSVWGAYNAVVYYNQYRRGNNRADFDEDRQLDSTFFGSSSNLNQLALNRALEFGKYGS